MKILNLVKETKSKWLNLFTAKYLNREGKECSWIFASRKNNPITDKKQDAVVIVPFLGNKVVLLKQFRVPVGDYIYEFPAGLINSGEKIIEAGMRELKEETGLDYVGGKVFRHILYNSCGMSDESISMMFVEASGEITTKYTEDSEDSEDIEVLVLSKEEVKKLLLDTNVFFSAKCWLILGAWANGYDWIKSSYDREDKFERECRNLVSEISEYKKVVSALTSQQSPCSPACYHHQTHPCEKCGRINGYLPIVWKEKNIEAMAKKVCELRQAIMEGKYDSRELVADVTLDMEGILMQCGFNVIEMMKERE